MAYFNIVGRIAGIAALVTTAALLCGAQPALAADRTDKQTTVKLTWARGGGNITLLARERGELVKRLAAQGINVEWVGPFSSHAQSIQAVVGKSADFSFGGSTTPGIAAILAGSPVVFTQFYIYQPRTSAIIARDGSGINKVADLVGKTVAVNRSGLGEVLLVAALEKHHIDRSQVKAVYMNAADAASALGAGKVDAWAWWSPAIDIARQNYRAHNVFIESEQDEIYDFSSFLTRRDFARDHPDLVRAVGEAYAAEGEWATAHSQEVEAISQATGKYSDEVKNYFISLRRQYQFYPADDAQFLHKLQRAADWLAQHNILPRAVKVDELIAER